MTRLFTVLMLMMVSMGAWADVKIFYGEKGEELKTDETKIKADNGTIAIEQKASDDGFSTTIYLTFTPETGYTISSDNIEVYAVISPNSSTTRTPEISGDPLKLNEESSKDPEKRYSVKIDSNLGLWIKNAEFVSASKGPTRDITVSSGVYYIASGGKAQAMGNGYTYSPSNPSNNFYLCPTEGWCYYKPTDDFSSDGTTYPNPFLTTYKCRTDDYHSGDPSDAIWTIEEAPNSNYYYIKQTSTGKHLLSNGQIRTTTNADRIRVHLEEVTGELDDKALFAIEPVSGKNYVVIRIVSSDGINGSHEWLSVNNGNYPNFVGNSGKTGGPTGYGNVSGIVCIYTQDDANAPFYLEKATVDSPTITNNFDGTFTITAETGATIYYTTDGTTPTTSTTTTGTTSVNVTQTESMTVIKAIAKGASDYFPSLVATYELPRCDKPVITVSGGTVTITCAIEGATIYYTTNGDPATSSSPNSSTSPVSFPKGDATTIRAIATKAGYVNSVEAQFLPPTEVSSSSQITEMSGNYILADNFAQTGSIGTSDNPFTGTIDGNMVTRSLSFPLVAYAEDATIKNVILKDITISGGTNVGAICNEARGASRIYNCGVLGTLTETKDANGKVTNITSTSTISGSGYVGSIVGLLDGTSRVINCYSFAKVSGGSVNAGIVGYNNQSSTQDDLKTVVVNCMFYGDITGSGYPVYGGNSINNNANNGINPYCYFRKNATFTVTGYNRSWPAEEKNLTRFEYYRSVLNSNRKLCTWWVTGTNGTAPTDDDVSDVGIAKWVLDPSIAPYPILKPWGKYPSIINLDPTRVWDPRTEDKEGNAMTPHWVNRSEANTWEGKSYGTLSVTINAGSHGSGSISKNITITDMDTLNCDYGYYKIQLPYYNEVFGNPNGATHAAKYAGNYTDYVVTGWDISDGSAATDYNFADRNSYSGRIFAQGGYFYVPEGVTSISITAHWGKAFYLANRGYSIDRVNVTAGGYRKADKTEANNFAPAGTVSNKFQGYDVYDDLQTAIGALGSGPTVYDQAIVLIGNHQVKNGSQSVAGSNNNWHPFTIMSADFDFDNEPDYCLQLQFRDGNDRPGIQPIRFDFLPVIELGLAVRHDNLAYAIGIMVPQGHFEITETALMRTTQFEWDANVTRYEAESPVILNGGEFEQLAVRFAAGNRTSYFLLGGHLWFHRFAPGSHPIKVNANIGNPRLCPVNVIGGDFPEFYLSGLYRPDKTAPSDQGDPKCYIDGGHFGTIHGAGYDKIDGSVTFKINHAAIGEFYGGGINGSKPIGGNIDVTIDNSRVDKYCGGPEVGDMTGKTVTTNATGTTFGVFFGGGNGGNSYYRQLQKDGDFVSSHIGTWTDNDFNWNLFDPLRVKDDDVDDENKGYHAEYEFEVFNQSNGVADQITQRGFIKWIQFGITKTGNVVNTLENCIIENNFYGGGNLATVDGTVTSTLTNTTVNGSVFGAGYSASIPTFQVHDKSTVSFPSITAGVITDGHIDYDSKVYEWTNDLNGLSESARKASPTYSKEVNGRTKWYCYTWNLLENLGAVLGDATLNIEGSTTVAGSVYGGGEESNVSGNTEVTMSGGSVAENVFGGGKGVADNFTCDKAMVGEVDKGETVANYPNGNTTVTITNGTVKGDVYGGGEVGRVEMNTSVTIGEAGNTTLTPIVEGHVFGAGAGVETHGYSALVRGNATVTIQGKAAVWQNVHGGGEKASVGRYYVAKDQSDVDTYHVRIGMPCYLKAGGKCTVNIQDDAVIGKDGLDDSGDVYGAGQGIRPDYRETDDAVTGKKRSRRMNIKTSDHNDSNKTYWDYYVDDEGNEDTRYVWEYFATKDDYLLYVETLARASETDVVIGGKRVDASTITPSSTAPTIKGSVYGGSESGFVYYGTVVNIPKGTVKGDAFGGGKGLADFQEAGRVKRNTSLTISGGTVEGNVYGGGSLGDVGTIDKTDQTNYNYTWKQADGTTDNTAGNNTITGTNNNTGICTVKISGGTIGADGVSTANHASGHVFGAGKGSSETWWCEKGVVFATSVSISAGKVYGNVYGGGEVGRVEDDAKVEIGASGGTGGAAPDIKGDVFGAGAGLATHGYSALVRGNAATTVQGTAQVGGSVYGGGEIASVGRFHVVGGLPKNPQAGGTCTVKIQGSAKIGTSGTGHNVFGACKGVTPAFVASGENRSKSMQLRTNAGKYSSWSNYNNDENSPFIWVYYETEADYLNFLKTLALTSNTHVTVGGSSEVYGSVFGGGERGVTLGGVDVNMTGGTVHEDVYGGGSLADSNRAMWDATNNRLYEYVPLELIPGLSHVTGYYKGDDHVLVTEENAVAGQGEVNSYSAIYKTNVNLTGGMIKGDAYGGGLGDLAAIGTGHSDVAAMVYGDVSVTLGDADNATKFNVSTINDNEGNPVVSSGRVFGCNNLNGSPMGSVLVTVNKTVAGNYSRTAEDPDNTGRPPMGDASPANRSYEVAAVYGGGNLSDYVPYSEEGESEKRMPRVRLTTCDISVEEVYGGGNAAKVPATDVQILGAYEIENVFGGGNGADKYTLNGTDWIINPGANVGSEANPGDANTLMKGGYIHSAYGGSNLKGEIFGTVYIDKTTGGCDGCPVQVDKMVAAGNNADFNSDVKVVVGCQGSDKTPMRFFGADNANVNGNVEVTITSGHFGKVFAGNNIGGAIRGHIIMNIEETSDCEPIRIDELYLGGNEAAYSRFGYYIKTTTSEGESATGYGDVTEEAALEDGRLVFMPRKSEDDPHYPVNTYNRETNTWTVIKDKNNYPLYANPVLNIISCTEIKEVFGGGYGDGAVMYADPTVNINMIKGSNYTNISATDDNPNQLGEIGEVFGGGNAAVVEGNTTVNVGMATTVDLISTEETGKTVLGAYITGSVFGGGNEANVTGDTHVNICGTQNPVLDSESNPVLDSEGKPTYTDTSVSHSGTFAVSIGNTVYGGGNAADVLGNTFVTMADGYVFNGIFGGGLSGSVGTFTTSTASAVVNIWGHTAHNGTCIGKPTACTSGGTCYVVVSGGQIGPVTVATEGMNRKTNGHGDPVPQGWVWGAGCGLVEDPSKEPDTHFKTYVNNTDVTIKGNAFILESIIGGGEFGRVLGNTLVKIEGGQIGVGADQTEKVNGVLKPKAYTTTQWTAAETAVRLGTASDINTAAAAMPACSHFPYGRNTGTEQAPNWVYETYDPYADLVTGTKPYPGGSTDNASDGKTWIGCVFAGGSGYMPYTTKDNEDNITGYDWVQSAGWVEGNAEVRISGGHILTNVYGGNEYTDVKGTCKVTMTGGTVGVPRTVDQIMANPMIGHIFGAGKGDPRVHFNKVTNVGDVEVEITGGIVYGSVFGGGEDGHVLRNVKMTIDEGAKIGTWGTTYIDGNVFGGGRGYSGDAYTAGNVAGSVEVEIKGGQILGSVYGGGQLGSVGYGLFDATTDGNPTPGYGEMRKDTDTETGFNTSGDFTEKGRGHIDLTISGGTIGNKYEYIFPQTSNIPESLPTNISTWTAANWTTWKNHNNIPKTEFDTTTGRVSHTKGGNVFAGGMGRMYQLDDTTPISSVDWWRMGCVKSTKLTISGNAIIKSTVFGGGELGQVVGYHTAKNAADADVNVGTEVIINGGTIGTEIKETVTTGTGESATTSEYTRFVYGGIFGGGYGSLVEKMTHTGDKTSYPKYIAGRVKAGTKVAMTAGTVLSSVYGGGKMAAVGESKMLDETEAGHGDTHVIISGGTIGKAPITLSDNSLRYFGGAKSGNVYGGGSGHNNTVRSGHIYGNTNVTINAGTVSGEPKIYHNVYGGGAYGSVGDFDYQTGSDYEGGPIKVKGINGLATTGTGVATVTITGGTIGYDGKENGMVFGSSRGDINKPGERDDYTAWVYDANVTIGDANSGPAIKGSVYGSGENGHTFNNCVVTVNKGTIGIADSSDPGYKVTSNGTEYSGAAYPYRGNVYGGGCGTDKYDSDGDGTEDTYNALAGIVKGNATVAMTGGHVVRNVYGAGAMGSVGTDGVANTGKTTVTISGGRVGVDGNGEGNGNGHVFGAARGEYGLDNSYAFVRETEVNIQYATTPTGDNEEKTAQLIAGSVFGGGEAGTVKESVTVNMAGGLVLKDIYGGGALADTQTNNWDATNNTWAEGKSSANSTITVNLTGGTINGDAFGGGLGQKTGFNGGTSDIPATVYGDITVNLGSIETPATEQTPAVIGPASAFNISYDNTDVKDETGNFIQVVQSGRVFGCNNLNGSPQGNVTVNVYKTVEGNVARTTPDPENSGLANRSTSVDHKYELAAVYGGGNLADYTATGKKASVTIHTCDVSVQHVYGGGNAAAVPETDVLVKGAWEIEHVFGGGNGKDKYKKGNEWITNAGADVSTSTNTLLIGGYIHEAYGGSNERGTIGGNVTINTNSKDERCACDLELVKLYGAGKNADIDGDLIVVLDCAPETKTEEIYGGAENANVRGNVELTITSGTFGKVFGGNNQSGAIFGHIILNIEETSCRPIVIDELYGCGNNAAYSVYGYKNGTDAEGNQTYVPRTSSSDGEAVTFKKDANQTAHTTPQYADPQVNIISCTRIGQVFGGGYGAGATVWGNPTVNINQIYGKAYSDANKTHYDAVATSLGEIGEVFGGGNEANVVGNTTVNIGTASTVQLHQSYDKKNGYSMSDDKPVLGANITGNVYGGGNKANVSGNTNVNIGKATTTTNTTTTP